MNNVYSFPQCAFLLICMPRGQNANTMDVQNQKRSPNSLFAIMFQLTRVYGRHQFSWRNADLGATKVAHPALGNRSLHYFKNEPIPCSMMRAQWWIFPESYYIAPSSITQKKSNLFCSPLNILQSVRKTGIQSCTHY